MEKITFKGLDPEDLHTCQHCKNAHYDIDIHSMVCPKGIILAEFYIQVNDCKDWLSPYLSDYRRRPDLESQLRKKAEIEVHGGVGWLRRGTSVIAVPDDWHDGDKVTVRISKINENDNENDNQ